MIKTIIKASLRSLDRPLSFQERKGLSQRKAILKGELPQIQKSLRLKKEVAGPGRIISLLKTYSSQAEKSIVCPKNI